MAAKKKTPSKKLPKAKLTRWHKLEQRRLKLQRQSKALGKLQAPLEDEFTEYVRAEGGEARKVTVHGFDLELKSEQCSVSWKSEFIKQTTEAEAERIIAAQPEKDVLVVEKVA